MPVVGCRVDMELLATLAAVLDSGPTRGTLALNADGSFTYTPAADYNGPDSFTYHATDGSLNSAPVTVTRDSKRYLEFSGRSRSSDPGPRHCERRR